MPTKIKLVDGASDGATHLMELTLRPIGFLDIVAMFGMELSKLSESLKLVSRLSGAPLDLLQWLTQDDILIVLAGLDKHMDNYNKKAGF